MLLNKYRFNINYKIKQENKMDKEYTLQVNEQEDLSEIVEKEEYIPYHH